MRYFHTRFDDTCAELMLAFMRNDQIMLMKKLEKRLCSIFNGLQNLVANEELKCVRKSP